MRFLFDCVHTGASTMSPEELCYEKWSVCLCFGIDTWLNVKVVQLVHFRVILDVGDWLMS